MSTVAIILYKANQVQNPVAIISYSIDFTLTTKTEKRNVSIMKMYVTSKSVCTLRKFVIALVSIPLAELGCVR